MGAKPAISRDTAADEGIRVVASPVRQDGRSIPATLIVISLSLFAFALRLYRASHYGLNGDEAFEARMLSQGVSAILSATTSGDPHPPLYYLTLYLWSMIAGDGELALRLPGIIAGTLAVPVVYRIGRWLLPPSAAIFGALWLATHPYMVWYAHEARMYLPATLFAALAVASLLRYLRRPSRRLLVAYTLVGAAALYTHYYLAFVMAGLALYWLIVALRLGETCEKTAALRPWLLAHLALAALFLPWLLYASRMIASYSALSPRSVVSLGEELLSRLAGGHTLVGWQYESLAGLLIVAVGLVGLVAYGRGAPVVVIWAFFPLILGLIGSLFRPMLIPRYLIVSWGAFALAIGLGVALLWRFRFGKPLALLLFLGLIGVNGLGLRNLYFDEFYSRSGYDRLVGYIQTHQSDDELIVATGWTQRDMLWYYYEHAPNASVDKPILPIEVLSATTGAEKAEALRLLGELAPKYRGIWLLTTDSGRYDPEGAIERALTANGHYVFERWFIHNRLAYFRTAVDGATAVGTTLDARFGGGMTLVSASLGRSSYIPGEIVTLGLRWRADGESRERYRVSLALRDGQGRAIATVDREPGGGAYRTDSLSNGAEVIDRYALSLPEWLPPGDYSVVVALYGADSGRRPTITQGKREDGSPREHPTGLTVGQVKVEADSSDRPAVVEKEEHPPKISLGARLGWADLVGIDPPEASARYGAGETLPLRLYLRPRGKPEGPLRLVIEYRPAGGAGAAGVAQTTKVEIPSDGWPSGRVVGPALDVAIPARLPSGRYDLILRESGPGGETVALGTVSVLAPERETALPEGLVAVGKTLGGFAELAGYLSGPAAPGRGGVLSLTLLWRAKAETEARLKVFVHVVGPDGKLLTQRDSPPLSGKRPTTSWVTDEALADPYTLALPPDAPAGVYRVLVGLYDEATGKRLALPDGSGDAIEVLQFRLD